jgi:hypothetical protein
VPWIALAGRAKALGEVDLVAVTGLDVALYLVERCFVRRGQVATIGASSAKSPVWWLLRTADQALPFASARLGWNTSWLVPRR